MPKHSLIGCAQTPSIPRDSYWFEERLKEPARVKKQSGIFISSMGDLMGHWNSAENIQRVLDMCAQNPQHIFFILTKAHARLRAFTYPKNVWVGVSSPPDFMNGRYLDDNQKHRYMMGAFEVLLPLHCQGVTTFMSFEPLSWDVSPVAGEALSWAIIGAGSNGPQKIQPDPQHVRNLLRVLDAHQTPVYFKENLNWNPVRREFPAQEMEQS
jgi:protein gp37